MRTAYEKGGPGVELYDALNAAPPPMKGDVEFYLRQARSTGGPVLELGVGTGRVAGPLHRAGVEIVGLDRSRYMLDIARRKFPGLALVRGDMARFDLRRKFRLITIPFRAFQHLKTPRDQRACLASVRQHLHRDGRFIVNLFDPRLEFCTPDAMTPVDRGRVRHPVSGRMVTIRVENRRNDPLTQTLTETWVYEEAGGRTWRDTLSLRWTYRFEMRHLLELAGFEPVACYGDFRKGPPKYGAEQIWVSRLSRKP